MKTFDVAIIGGGIVGLATAYHALARFPQLRLVLLEKEAQLAQHQTGRNSGVLHSGVYYRPGSLKAINCRLGKQALEQFCRDEDVPYEVCGKVIVATSQAELPALQTIYERGLANGVSCKLIGPEQLAKLEPHAAGIQALHVPETGIVDFPEVCVRLAERIKQGSGQVICSARVTDIKREAEQLVLESTAGTCTTRHLINCAGLYSDRVARLAGQPVSEQIVPFRGEYFELAPAARHLCRNLIYPVPDPSFPFLGVHFTRMIGGGVECGPNAVLAFAREGYLKLDIKLDELTETLTYPGFWKLARRYWRTGAAEMWRSLSKRAFVRALQRLVPAITEQDLMPAASGVRAQAVSRDGMLIDDFLITESAGVISVCNAPSPAATASLNIGRLVVEKLASRLN